MRDSLQIEGLTVQVGDTPLVQDVDLRLESGELVGLVGRSGSGKSITSLALLGLIDLEPGVIRGELTLTVNGAQHSPYRDLHRAGARARDRAFRAIRGHAIGYLPQDCRAALDPLARVGQQVARVARLDGGAADPRPWLERANLPDPARVAALYPHELSGGMAQRVVIAQALARGSRFLIADEPTSALDPTVQAGVLRELRDLADRGIGVLLITHDLRVLPGLAERILIMDGGRLVESAPAQALTTGTLTSPAGKRLVAATARVAGGVLG